MTDLPSTRVRNAVRLAALALGAAQAWMTRGTMNPDGISYLDLSDAVVRRPWALPVNGYWSPGYPWLIGVWRRITGNSAAGEFASVHVLNFVIFAAVLAAFDWLLAELRRAWPERCASVGWTIGAYAVFIWGVLGMTSLTGVTPDLAVAGVVFAVSALLIRIAAANAPAHRGAALVGALLGAGYLLKAVMFPLAAAFLAALALTGRGWRMRIARFTIAAAAFAIVALPYAGAVSAAKGRLTFGDSGRLNYGWYVREERDPEATYLVHPARLLSTDPRAYEFAAPVAGTYPRSFDPSYWYDGLRPTPASWTRQSTVLALNLSYYWFLLWPVVLVAIGAACVAGVDRRALASPAVWQLVIPAVATLVLYALVHVEARFLGASVVLLTMALLMTLGGARRQRASRGRLLLAVALVSIATAWGAPRGTSVRDELLLVLAVAPAIAMVLAGGIRRGAVGRERLALLLLLAAVLCVAGWVYPALLVLVVPLVWVLTLASGWLGDGMPTMAAAGAAMLVIGAVRVVQLAGTLERDASDGGAAPTQVQARSLAAAGVASGDRVAVIGNAEGAYWARLLRARIVAEVRDSDSARFWSAPAADQERLLARFRASGARSVIALRAGSATPLCWRSAEGGLLFRRLDEPRSAVAPDSSCSAPAPGR